MINMFYNQKDKESILHIFHHHNNHLDKNIISLQHHIFDQLLNCMKCIEFQYYNFNMSNDIAGK